MGTFKVRALVLKEVFVGESDKILTLFAKEYGKLSVSAKGARKPKSKFLAGTQLFSYADYIIYDGGKFYSLSQVDMIESFYKLRNDYERLCHANYILELTDKTILFHLQCDDILYLALKSLSALEKGIFTPRLVSVIFDFKFLQFNGYGANIGYCCKCGKNCSIWKDTYFGEHGVVCADCRRSEKKTFKISESALEAINYILINQTRELFKFTVSESALLELMDASRLMMDAHFDLRLKSRELINNY